MLRWEDLKCVGLASLGLSAVSRGDGGGGCSGTKSFLLSPSVLSLSVAMLKAGLVLDQGLEVGWRAVLSYPLCGRGPVGF